ncbi:MAG TPA: helix-turn-helix transcriptional regulator [Candidatus Fimivivens faecavium]|nr:helix-turn-helix transcriptional regulator [Candidatus Fimivivens faecavium]
MLSERIRSLRNNRGISQVELAEALHVTKQSVSNWENNNIQPSIEVLVKIARYFSVRADYLLGFDDRDYIEITGLSEKELDHIRLIIEDIRKKKETESPDF